MPEILEMINTPAESFRQAPMPRQKVTKVQWEQAAGDAARGMLTMLSLWATRGAVHMALLNEKTKCVGILSLEKRRGSFPSVGRVHAPAQRLERAIFDLYGMVPEGASDARRWLDHGKWGVSYPLGKPGQERPTVDYAFLPVEGESLHQVPVGPVHAGIIEPGHFRFTGQGEAVVRLEERFGYVHKGIDKLMSGASLARGAELAGRVSGDSTVAYAWAYAQAVESALGVKVPTRADWLRTLMAEIERLASHIGDVGAICNDAAFAMMLAQCGALRERIMRAANTVFGHRFMRDLIVPGGVLCDLDAKGRSTLEALVQDITREFAFLVELYDNKPTLLDRTVGAGFLKPTLACCFGAGGVVGRASGRLFDTRRELPYGPYDELSFEVASRTESDVNARIWVRIDEVWQSLSLIDQILGRMPDGAVFTDPVPAGETREGLGLVEGFRGDILVWVAIDAKNNLKRCHLRDPSWFQWPLLEAAIEDNIIADFPICNKSFNCSYSGPDL